MHEKEGTKMLKWLKQKPAGHHHNSRNSQGKDHEVGQNKIITDDPLATIQVHPQQKKSKNKSEEIYAVSRVNPLFEEEDVPKGVVRVGEGINSGSSGYDSGPTSDDDDLKFHHRRTDNSSTSSTSSFSVLSRAPQKHGQLFSDEDDPVVHHQAAILSPEGRPVLHIVEQNPDFVQSIAVAISGRPLSPIDESSPEISHRRLGHQDAIKSDRSTKVSVHPIPTRPAEGLGEDYLGVAKLVHKENRYVQSINIGSPSNKQRANNKRPGSSQAGSSRVLQSTPYPPSTSVTRKPSVTFSERVELVVDSNGHGKLLVKGPTPYRKPSAEQDSIVTESLLLMTSSRPAGQDSTNINHTNSNHNNSNAINNSGNINRLINSSKSPPLDGLPPLRKVSTNSSNSNGDGRDESQRIEDLEAFSSSIRRNHPVKHILSNSGKSLEINPAADHYSSAEFLEENASGGGGDIDHRRNHHHTHTRLSEERDVDHDDECDECCNDDNSYDMDETRSSSNNQQEKRCRRPRGAVCPKSPFGGIADHYAAAREVAKEIESYSNGSGKSNATKKSIVRELLTGRGRDARRSADDPQNNSSGGAPTGSTNGSKKYQKVSPGSSPRHVPVTSSQAAHNEAIEAWESVRVQQVYLKGRSWKEIEPSSSSSASSSSSSAPPSPSSISTREEEGDAGQRVLSVIQQGQVHSNKLKDRGTTTTKSTNPSANSTSILLQQSASNNKQQHLKGSIYDGLSSEGASSNNEGDDDASSDSGNSTDRNSKGSRHDLLSERRAGPSRTSKGSGAKPPDPSAIEEGPTSSSSSNGSIDKVMIVTGDSKNMVVDLSGIPLDLREAIISGSALITLPDGLNASSGGSSSSNKGGYTIVSIPTSSSHGQGSSSKEQGSSSNSKKPLSELEIKAIPIPASDNLHKLEMGELYNHIFNTYGTKNKTQIWDVMQQSVQQTLIEDEKGKKKRITTVLPFHPNQDVYKSPDFTMEGQRLERQRKKLDVAKKRRCVCRVFGILFFLATFIGVLVALSMIYTKGQRYFGSA